MSFAATAEEFLRLMGHDPDVKQSVRAPGNSLIGHERSSRGFDYLFLTEDAICFLRPNPTPPVMARLSLSSLTGLELNATNLLFLEAEPHAHVTVAEGRKGWGSKIKGVTTEELEAESFFAMFPSWAILRRDLAFADSVASSAGLSRRQDDELQDLGITAWGRNDPVATAQEHDAPETTPIAQVPIEDLSNAELRRERDAGLVEQSVDDLSVTIDVESHNFVGAPDRFHRLFESFQDDSRMVVLGGLRPDEAHVMEPIDEVFQANARRAYQALPAGSDEFRQEFARRMYTLMVWGWAVTEALLKLRGLFAELGRPVEEIRGLADSLLQDFDLNSMSDAGFYVVDNLRGYTVAQTLEIPIEVAESHMLANWMVQQGDQAVLFGVTFAMAAAGVREL